MRTCPILDSRRPSSISLQAPTSATRASGSVLEFWSFPDLGFGAWSYSLSVFLRVHSWWNKDLTWYGDQNRRPPRRAEARAESQPALRAVGSENPEPGEGLGFIEGHAGLHRHGEVHFARLDRVDARFSVRFSAAAI